MPRPPIHPRLRSQLQACGEVAVVSNIEQLTVRAIVDAVDAAARIEDQVHPQVPAFLGSTGDNSQLVAIVGRGDQVVTCL
jgi:hypothetical protein